MTRLQSQWGSLVVAGLLCFSGALIAGCNAAPSTDTRAADEATIRKLDADWVKAKQVDAWVAFYADDAAVLPPNDKMATDKATIRKYVAELLSAPGLSLHWEPVKVEVAKGGDLAYLYGTYGLTVDGPGGKSIADTGKIVEIWKKQADGSWKCIVDTWSSDLPAVASAL
jgi:ketosteroid isomerase-like protein